MSLLNYAKPSLKGAIQEGIKSTKGLTAVQKPIPAKKQPQSIVPRAKQQGTAFSVIKEPQRVASYQEDLNTKIGKIKGLLDSVGEDELSSEDKAALSAELDSTQSELNQSAIGESKSFVRQKLPEVREYDPYQARQVESYLKGKDKNIKNVINPNIAQFAARRITGGAEKLAGQLLNAPQALTSFLAQSDRDKAKQAGQTLEEVGRKLVTSNVPFVTAPINNLGEAIQRTGQTLQVNPSQAVPAPIRTIREAIQANIKGNPIQSAARAVQPATRLLTDKLANSIYQRGEEVADLGSQQDFRQSNPIQAGVVDLGAGLVEFAATKRLVPGFGAANQAIEAGIERAIPVVTQGGLKGAILSGARNVGIEAASNALTAPIQTAVLDPGEQIARNPNLPYNPAQTAIRTIEETPEQIALGAIFGGVAGAGKAGLRAAGKQINNFRENQTLKAESQNRTNALTALRDTQPTTAAETQANNNLSSLQENLRDINEQIDLYKDFDTEKAQSKRQKLETKKTEIENQIKYQTDPAYKARTDRLSEIDNQSKMLSDELKTLESQRQATGLYDENQAKALQSQLRQTQFEKQLIEQGRTPQEAQEFIQKSIQKAQAKQQNQEQSQKLTNALTALRDAKPGNTDIDSIIQKVRYENDPVFRETKDRLDEIEAQNKDLKDQIKALSEEKNIGGLIDENELNSLKYRLDRNNFEKRLLNEGKTRSEAEAQIVETIGRNEQAKLAEQRRIESERQNKAEAERVEAERKAEQKRLDDERKKAEKQRLEREKKDSSNREKFNNQAEILEAKPKITKVDLLRLEQTSRKFKGDESTKERYKKLEERFSEQERQGAELEKVDLEMKRINSESRQGFLNKQTKDLKIKELKKKKKKIIDSNPVSRKAIESLFNEESGLGEKNLAEVMEAAGLPTDGIDRKALFRTAPDKIKKQFKDNAGSILERQQFKDYLENSRKQLNEAGIGAEEINAQAEKTGNDLVSRNEADFEKFQKESLEKLEKDFDNVKTEEDLEKAYDSFIDNSDYEALGDDFYNRLSEKRAEAEKRIQNPEQNLEQNQETKSIEKLQEEASQKANPRSYAISISSFDSPSQFQVLRRNPDNFNTLSKQTEGLPRKTEAVISKLAEIKTKQKSNEYSLEESKEAFKKLLEKSGKTSHTVTINGKEYTLEAGKRKGEVILNAKGEAALEQVLNEARAKGETTFKTGNDVLNVQPREVAITKTRSAQNTLDATAKQVIEFSRRQLGLDAAEARLKEIVKDEILPKLPDNGLRNEWRDKDRKAVFWVSKGKTNEILSPEAKAKVQEVKSNPENVEGRQPDTNVLKGTSEAVNDIQFGIQGKAKESKQLLKQKKEEFIELVNEQVEREIDEELAREDAENRNSESIETAQQGLDLMSKDAEINGKIDDEIAKETKTSLKRITKMFSVSPGVLGLSKAARAIIDGNGLADSIELISNFIPKGWTQNLSSAKLLGKDLRIRELVSGLVFNVPKTIDENLSSIGRKRGEEAGIHKKFLDNFTKLETRIRKFDGDLAYKNEEIYQKIQDLIREKGIDEILDKDGNLKEQYKDSALGAYLETRASMKRDLVDYAEDYKDLYAAKAAKAEKELSKYEGRKDLTAIEKRRFEELKKEKTELDKSLVFLDDKIGHLKMVSGNSLLDALQGLGYKAVLWNNPSVAALNLFDALQIRSDARIMGNGNPLINIINNQFDRAYFSLFTGKHQKNKDGILSYFGAAKTGSYNDILANRAAYRNDKNPLAKVWNFLENADMNKAIADLNNDAVVLASTRNWYESKAEYKKYPDPVENYTAFRKEAPPQIQAELLTHLSVDKGLLTGNGSSGSDFALGGLARNPISKQIITFIKPAYRVASNLRRNYTTLVEALTPEKDGKLTLDLSALVKNEKAQKAAVSLIANFGSMYAIGGTTALAGAPGFGMWVNAILKAGSIEERDELEKDLNKFSLGYNFAPGFGERLQIQARSVEKNAVIGLVKNRLKQLSEPLTASYVNQIIGVFDKLAKYQDEVKAGNASWKEFPPSEGLKLLGKILPTQVLSKVEQLINEEYKTIYDTSGVIPKKIGEVPTKGDFALALSGSNKTVEAIKKANEAKKEAYANIARFDGKESVFVNQTAFNQQVKRAAQLTGETEADIKEDWLKKRKAALQSKSEASGNINDPGSLSMSDFSSKFKYSSSEKQAQIITLYEQALNTETDKTEKKQIKNQLKKAREMQKSTSRLKAAMLKQD